MIVDKDTLYDLLNAAILDTDVAPADIRFGASLPTDLDKDKNYLRFSYDLTDSRFLDLTQLLKEKTYNVEVEVLGPDEDTLFDLVNTVVSAMYSTYTTDNTNLTEHTGAQELLYDEDLKMFTIIPSFTIII